MRIGRINDLFSAASWESALPPWAGPEELNCGFVRPDPPLLSDPWPDLPLGTDHHPGPRPSLCHGLWWRQQLACVRPCGPGHLHPTHQPRRESGISRCLCCGGKRHRTPALPVEAGHHKRGDRCGHVQHRLGPAGRWRVLHRHRVQHRWERHQQRRHPQRHPDSCGGGPGHQHPAHQPLCDPGGRSHLHRGGHWHRAPALPVEAGHHKRGDRCGHAQHRLSPANGCRVIHRYRVQHRRQHHQQCRRPHRQCRQQHPPPM